MKRVALVLMLLAVAAPELAVEGAADPGLEAMRAISFLEGRWEGEGWMQHGSAEPEHFRSSELVEARLDGRVLIVEGLHHDKETGEEVHHALAAISYDPEAAQYRFRSHLSTGRSGDHAGRLEDGAFIWDFETPQGQIRFTIRIAEGRWSEVGEFSPDGEQWNQFFAMELEKTGD